MTLDLSSSLTCPYPSLFLGQRHVSLHASVLIVISIVKVVQCRFFFNLASSPSKRPNTRLIRRCPMQNKNKILNNKLFHIGHLQKILVDAECGMPQVPVAQVLLERVPNVEYVTPSSHIISHTGYRLFLWYKKIRFQEGQLLAQQHSKYEKNLTGLHSNKYQLRYINCTIIYSLRGNELLSEVFGTPFPPARLLNAILYFTSFALDAGAIGTVAFYVHFWLLLNPVLYLIDTDRLQ